MPCPLPALPLPQRSCKQHELSRGPCKLWQKLVLRRLHFSGGRATFRARSSQHSGHPGSPHSRTGRTCSCADTKQPFSRYRRRRRQHRRGTATTISSRDSSCKESWWQPCLALPWPGSRAAVSESCGEASLWRTRKAVLCCAGQDIPASRRTQLLRRTHLRTGQLRPGNGAPSFGVCRMLCHVMSRPLNLLCSACSEISLDMPRHR